MPKFLRIFIVFSIILVWAFYGHPQIWPPQGFENQSVKIPPKVEEVQALSVVAGDGLMIFSALNNVSRWTTYTSSSDSFAASSSIDIGSGGKSHIIKTSPTQQEAIAVWATSTTLQVTCYNGTSWYNEWTTSTVANNTFRGFDVAYEASSGDAMVLYSTATSTTNELEYRTKSGTTGCGSANWSAATKLDPVRTSGVVDWVKLSQDRRTTSTLITAVWLDSNMDISSMQWSGTAWGNEPSAALETSVEKANNLNNYPDVDLFDVEYESGSGDVMVVWANSAGANGTNGTRYVACTDGTATCTWSATSTITSLLDDATNLDISVNPNSDEIVFASIGNAGGDLQAAYWDGSTWTGTANLDATTSVPFAGTKLVATGWLISGATTRSIIAYNDSAETGISYYIGSGSSFSVATDFSPSTAFGNPQKWYDIQTDPINKDGLIFTLSDTNNDLFAKRLKMDSTPTFTWTNSDGGSLNTNLVAALLGPASFVYWNFIPTATISCATDVSATDFGVLASDTISTSTPNASTTMTCANTSSGCSLKIYDDGSSGNPGLWNSNSLVLIESPDAAFNATATLTFGTEGYGIQATTTAVGSGGSLTIAERYIQKPDQVNLVGGLKLKATPVTIASSTADVTNREVVVTHKAAVSSTTPGGSYNDSITLSCYVN